MQDHIRLRPAQQDDYDWLRQVHHLTLRRSVEAIWGWDEADQDRRFAASFDATDVQIVEIDGQPMGMIQVKRTANGIFLGGIQMLPEYQGRGIGSTLIRALQKDAAEAQLPLELQVLTSNRARRLYERLGFVVVSRREPRLFMRWTCGPSEG